MKSAFLLLALTLFASACTADATPPITISIDRTTHHRPDPDWMGVISDEDFERITQRAVTFWADKGYALEYVPTGGQIVVTWDYCDIFVGACTQVDEGFIKVSPDLSWWDAVEVPACPHTDAGLSWALDLNTVMKHELGHVLGFGHVEDTHDIMYSDVAICEVRTETGF